MTKKTVKQAAKKVVRGPTPRQATTNKRICALPFDNVSHPDFWMAVDERDVSIFKQRSGEVATGRVTIPRRVFDLFVDWYNTGKIPSFEKRKPNE